MTTREQAVRMMQNWCRDPEAHAEIIRIYNTQDPLPRCWRMSMGQDWCAATVSAVSVALNIREYMPTECSVGKMTDLYKRIGRWMENDAYVPKPGDLIQYDWQDNGKGDCLGWPDHVGMVESCDGKNMVLMEGNFGGGVNRRKLQVNAPKIRGYCLPDYEAADHAGPRQKSPEEITVEHAVQDIGLDPYFWLDVLQGTKQAKTWHIKPLMDKYHEALKKK